MKNNFDYLNLMKIEQKRKIWTNGTYKYISVKFLNKVLGIRIKYYIKKQYIKIKWGRIYSRFQG